MKFEQCAFLFAFVVLAASAAPAILQNDPKRPVALIAADLGITAVQFVSCFNGVSPAPQGSAPTAAQVHANKQHLLTCLQQFKPTLTNNQLDAVMDKYRPAPGK